MTKSPIHKALFLIQKHKLRALLMGGQACVLYGAAEFSRDLDLACYITPAEMERWKVALREIQAEVIAVPPFDLELLAKGHAVHFRCHHPEILGLRIDILSKMRGVSPFEELWARRTTLELPPDLQVEVLSLPDLVRAKKTQRDKDWPMIRRLLEADYLRAKSDADLNQKKFWLRELRTPEFLIDLIAGDPDLAQEMCHERSDVIYGALSASVSAIERALREEEHEERERDRHYWGKLRRELEVIRLSKRGKKGKE